MDDIRALIEQADTSAALSRAAAEAIVKALRKSKVRRPDILAPIGHQVIQNRLISNAELFTLYETVFMAALDYGDDVLAAKCLQHLVKQFPGSSRVKRLLAMNEESKGQYASALTMYDELLEENPVNMLAMKRKVAIHKAQYHYKEACEALHAIVHIYQNDLPSWLELAELHSAAHCLEEVILLSSQNPIYHTRLAEVYYTIGSPENLLKARKHYSISLNFHAPAHNSRALYGMYLTCLAINTIIKKIPASEAAVNEAMLSWTKEQLGKRSGVAAKVGACLSSMSDGVEEEHK